MTTAAPAVRPSAADVQAYRDRGYLVARRLFDPAEMLALRRVPRQDDEKYAEFGKTAMDFR